MSIVAVSIQRLGSCRCFPDRIVKAHWFGVLMEVPELPSSLLLCHYCWVPSLFTALICVLPDWIAEIETQRLQGEEKSVTWLKLRHLSCLSPLPLVMLWVTREPTLWLSVQISATFCPWAPHNKLPRWLKALRGLLWVLWAMVLLIASSLSGQPNITLFEIQQELAT